MRRQLTGLLRRPKRIVLACLVVATVQLALIGWLLIDRRVAAQRQLTMIHERTETIQQPIQFGVRRVKSYAHPVTHKEVKIAGKPGAKELIYAIKTRGDGTEIARTKTSEIVTAQPTEQVEVIGARLPQALTKAKSAQVFTDARGVAHRETYYDLPMNVVTQSCGAGGRYSVREDGAKVDKDGFVLVAAHYGHYPKCSVVQTSMGPGKVYDTGGFTARHPHGFDLATDWTNGDGR